MVVILNEREMTEKVVAVNNLADFVGIGGIIKE